MRLFLGGYAGIGAIRLTHRKQPDLFASPFATTGEVGKTFSDVWKCSVVFLEASSFWKSEKYPFVRERERERESQECFATVLKTQFLKTTNSE